MEVKQFDIKLLDLHWVQNVDDPTDLCAHGYVWVKIGDEVVSDKNDSDITVSATALYLMRTLKGDYKPDDFASQLLPCCGYFMIADKEEDFVVICGCPNGIDWTIVHLKDSLVKHISRSGQVAIISFEDYKKLVLDFADKVENFYKNSLPKVIPTDDIDKNGYLTFWKEWRNLRQEWE